VTAEQNRKRKQAPTLLTLEDFKRELELTQGLLKNAKGNCRKLERKLARLTEGPPHVYIAHPLGNGPNREANRARAGRCLAWAATQGVIPVASWITLTGVWAETKGNREAGLALDLAQLARCDQLWTFGDSPGVRIERDRAVELEIPVVDQNEAFRLFDEYPAHEVIDQACENCGACGMGIALTRTPGGPWLCSLCG
jgi:hypothetical protein